MVHPDDLERVLARSGRSDRSGDPWVDEYRAIHRDGSVRWVHATARRVTPEGVSPAVWQGVTVDVTNEHRNREPDPDRAVRSGRRRR
jgi:PAS domain S-box-containing protein